MNILREVTTIDFQYDSEQERTEHVKFMESEGWSSSGQIKEQLMVYGLSPNKTVWVGKFSKTTR